MNITAFKLYHEYNLKVSLLQAGMDYKIMRMAGVLWQPLLFLSLSPNPLITLWIIHNTRQYDIGAYS